MSHQPPARNPRPGIGRKILTFGCLPLAVLFGALIALGVALDDGDDESDAKATTSATPSTPAPSSKKPAPSPSESDEGPGISKRRMTELSVGLVWDKYSDAQKDVLCTGVEAYGPEWLADQLQSDNLDHEYAGQLVEEKCANR
ncbi:hypothetical protein [Streptomyces coelicoflavus]|uniref:hypothetical protein n=1 Tax=Streptomyces coelicoflavus TaxID=285562 RepID=UPI000D591EC3|nr:hypothetical protein [Streptomyces coelicoflavus]